MPIELDYRPAPQAFVPIQESASFQFYPPASRPRRPDLSIVEGPKLNQILPEKPKFYSVPGLFKAVLTYSDDHGVNLRTATDFVLGPDKVAATHLDNISRYLSARESPTGTPDPLFHYDALRRATDDAVVSSRQHPEGIVAKRFVLAEVERLEKEERNKKINTEKEVNPGLEYLLALAEKTAFEKEGTGSKGDLESLTVINAADVKLPATVDGVHHINVVPAESDRTAEVVLLPKKRPNATDKEDVDAFVGWTVFADPNGGIVGGELSLMAIEALKKNPDIHPEWLQIRPVPEESPEGSPLYVIYVMPQQRLPDQELSSV